MPYRVPGSSYGEDSKDGLTFIETRRSTVIVERMGYDEPPNGGFFIGRNTPAEERISESEEMNMASAFVKKAPGVAPVLQQRNPGLGAGPANSQSLPMPSYSPPPGQMYGVDPMLMRIAMQKQMFEQRQKQRAVAEALRRGFETAKRWHDERRGLAPAAYGTAAGAVPLVSGRSATSAMPRAGAPGVQVREPAAGMIRFRDSQGGIHDIPHENLGRAWMRDRGLKPIG